MSSIIDLGEYTNTTFTSGDKVRGNLVLHFDSPTTVTNIVVKLEGISFSRVPVDYYGFKRETKYTSLQKYINNTSGQYSQFDIESHKFLYQTQEVFPPTKVHNVTESSPTSIGQFTLPAGEHKFPFEFQIPYETFCEASKPRSWHSFSRIVVDRRTGIELISDPHSHIQSKLPPSLSDMTGFAYVRYLLKATVNRSSTFKVNKRLYQPLVFLPPNTHEPDENPGELLFVRQEAPAWLEQPSSAYLAQYKRQTEKDSGSFKQGANKIKSFISSVVNESALKADPLSVPLKLDMRYSKYFDTTRQLPIQLFVLMTASSFNQALSMGSNGGGFSSIYLNQLKAILHITTETRAKSNVMAHKHKKVLFEWNGQMEFPLKEFTQCPASSSDEKGLQIEIPSELWCDFRFQDSVSPSFQVCNIKRSHILEIRAGISILPNCYPNDLGVVAPIELMSGISHPCMGSSQGIAPPHYSMLQNELNNGDADGLPSYTDTFLNSDSQGSSQLNDSRNHRRAYHQSESYYKDFESTDTDLKK